MTIFQGFCTNASILYMMIRLYVYEST